MTGRLPNCTSFEPPARTQSRRPRSIPIAAAESGSKTSETSTYAAVAAGVKRVRARGMNAAHVHLRHLNPLPSNLGEVLDRYTQVLVPEINLGQLSRILRAEYLVDAQTMSKMQGVPFRVGEIEAAITALLGGKS